MFCLRYASAALRQRCGDLAINRKRSSDGFGTELSSMCWLRGFAAGRREDDWRGDARPHQRATVPSRGAFWMELRGQRLLLLQCWRQNVSNAPCNDCSWISRWMVL